ncbi:MAG: glycosyltransferase family 2 protein [Candidatus Lokiarchaeota archaeon]|nr:glycosyltransferase family 2 protein [Candidatus Lokiarchaeota archaeon]
MNGPKILGYVAIVLGIFALWTWAFQYLEPLGVASWVYRPYFYDLFADFNANQANLGTFIALMPLVGLTTFFGVMALAVLEPTKQPKEFFTPSISIVIASKDEAPLLKRTLDSIVASDYPKDKMQVIVVTSNSSDGSEKFLEKYFTDHPSIDWLNLSEPLSKPGKPPALNYALKSVKNDILVLYDAGSILKVDTLKQLVTPLKDESIKAVQGAIVVKNWDKNRLTRAILLDYAMISGGNMHFETVNKLGKNCWLYGRNMGVRMDVVRKFGGFDETSLTEDLYISSLMNAHGLRIKFVPTSKVYEIVPSEWKILQKQRTRWVGGFTGDIPKLLQLKVDGKPAGPKEMLGRFLSMQFLGNISIWSTIALIFVGVYAAFLEFYLLGWAALCYLFMGIWIVGSIKRYCEGNAKGLLSFGTVIKIHAFMMGLSTHLPKVISWEQTPQLLSMSKEEITDLANDDSILVSSPQKAIAAT